MALMVHVDNAYDEGDAADGENDDEEGGRVNVNDDQICRRRASPTMLMSVFADVHCSSPRHQT